MVANKEAKKTGGDSRDSKTAATGDDLKKEGAVKKKAPSQKPLDNNTSKTNEEPATEEDAKKMSKEVDLKKAKSLKEEASSDKDAEDETGIMFMDAFDETSFGKQVKEDALEEAKSRPKKPESVSKEEVEEEKSKAKALLDRIKKLPFTIKADQSDKQEDKEDKLIVPDPVEEGELGEMCRHPELRRRGGRWSCCYTDTQWFCAKCDQRVTE